MHAQQLARINISVLKFGTCAHFTCTEALLAPSRASADEADLPCGATTLASIAVH